jgi:drug/metabolite transporter (DMT)-like permease
MSLAEDPHEWVDEESADMHHSDPRSVAPYVWMTVGAIAFAAMAEFATEAGRYCDWQIVAIARSGLAMVFAGMLAVGAGAKLVFLRPRTLWLRSLAGSMSLLCTFYALTRLPTADVLTLTNTFPIWVAILSWPMLGKPPTLAVLLAAIFGIAGVALIQQAHQQPDQLTQGVFSDSFATIASLVSAFTSAVALIGLHKLQGIDTRAVVVHFSGVGLALCIVAYFVFDRTHPKPSLDSHTLGLLLGVGASATFGQICLTKAYSTGLPGKVSVVGLTQVVFVMLYEACFGDRSFELVSLHTLGIVLVLLPTAWMMLRKE